MADGWIELFDVETDEVELLFVFDRFEPVDYGCGVFPLVEVVFFRDCAVDAVEDVFADFAYLGLSGVDESAGRFVCEVRLVILKCYECVFVGCSVHSVVDSQFCRDGFVFFMDCLRRLGLCFLFFSHIYFALLPCIEHCFTNIKFTLYIYIYNYIYTVK